MPTPIEPEKYSVDEMMERLKIRQADEMIDEGELVIRADGSQAIRVRKRKRRSQQPHKEQRKSLRRVHMIQVALVLIFVLLTFGVAGVAIVYVNSAPFRTQLLEEISRCSGASVAVEQFRVNPTSANAGQLSFTWPDGDLLGEMKLKNVIADLSPVSLLGRSLSGEELSCAECSLILRVPRADQPAREGPASGGPLPIRFNRYAFPKAHVLLGDPAAPLFHLRNADASFYPVSASERAQLLISHGDIALRDWPKLRMDRSHIEFRGNALDVVVMRLRHETDNRGLFELAGSLAPYRTGTPSTLAIRLENYLLAGLAGPDFGRLFTGRIDSGPDVKSNYLSLTTGAAPSATLHLGFSNSLASGFSINGLPFLFGLSQTLGDVWFERPVFDSEVSGVLTREAGRVAMSGIDFKSKGRMAMRGELSVAGNQSLSGHLEVGIAEAMIQASKSRLLEAVFGPPTDGFRWVSLKIEGSAAVPKDNFRHLIESAARAPQPETSGEIPSFEQLTQPP